MRRIIRQQIGSYLGLKLEAGSCTFSKFQDEGLMEVKRRQIRTIDQLGLRRIVNSAAT
ncbi:helix-turn-helix domain-containing protein [Burkholderiaceae bacterium UC74_6]